MQNFEVTGFVLRNYGTHAGESCEVRTYRAKSSGNAVKRFRREFKGVVRIQGITAIAKVRKA